MPFVLLEIHGLVEASEDHLQRFASFLMRECTALPGLAYNKQYFWIMYPMVP